MSGIASAENNGYITSQDGQQLFPLGFYELPKNDSDLSLMAASGVNLIRCKSKEELDRVAKAGIMGVMSLDLSQGNTAELRAQILSVKDHPALALWEGPDEIVWRFTGWSHLWREGPRKVYQHDGEWWMQTPEVMRHSEKMADEIIPKLIDGINLLRNLDNKNRPIWLNEARNSDVKFCRRYMDHIDITGCDYYPVRGKIRDSIKLGVTTQRWNQTGRGKPVWMVLQAFSWSSLGGSDSFPEAYPSFNESRLMAYISIVYGAKGLLYWGSSQKRTPSDFRESLYAMTHELNTLQPFLTEADEDCETVTIIESMTAGIVEGWFEKNEAWPPPRKLGVRSSLRRVGNEWLLVLVNEDNYPHYGVEVSGLEKLNGSELHLLYGDETAAITHGDFTTRMKPFEVKVFASSKKWESDHISGRKYAGIIAE